MNDFYNILVHYGEIALKGRNKPLFLQRLVENIRQALTGLPLDWIQRLSGRLWLQAKPQESFRSESLNRLQTVFGIASFAPALRVPLNYTSITHAAWDLLKERRYQSFRVRARRAFKDVPFPSQEVNEKVGAFIKAQRDVPVRMKGAEAEVCIEIMPQAAYMYVDKYPGLGGLPVGSSGQVGCLLSGGIDSPVAMHRMQRRGLRGVLIHFHSVPFLSRMSQDKAQDLAELLARYQGPTVLYLVPFGPLQREIVEHTPAKLRVVLYRRFMLRIAAALSRRHGAQALVTGESMGQVASQTLRNMVAIEAASPMPVLRPLVGFDKQEIIREAQALGSFETSIIPDEDCCRLFMPSHPETAAHLPAVEAAERALDVEALCQDALAQTQRQDVQAPWLETPTRVPSFSCPML